MVRNIQRKFKQIATEINTFKQPNHLVDDGLFRYSRNPIYLGFTLSLFGLALLTANLAAFDVVFFFLVVHFWYIPFEERIMEKEFGSDYINYKKQVRRWL